MAAARISDLIDEQHIELASTKIEMERGVTK
jgi:hypothetical protein